MVDLHLLPGPDIDAYAAAAPRRLPRTLPTEARSMVMRAMHRRA